jgi:hypothetical protein
MGAILGMIERFNYHFTGIYANAIPQPYFIPVLDADCIHLFILIPAFQFLAGSLIVRYQPQLDVVWYQVD